ncbi:YfcC family protein [Entomospira nematocerorum]|uniref:YfcC family protein n=1 Tax=Entomospira nematocerorum TaxID=2719987 RepID=A0A968GGM6_9SPIO|nr:YfcC family protein [Entomospira nematocera]NIZ47471.1 YfcC family protein [Entomospira nematocera]WDI33989.1 YfcC family protein [Entomospira nematocera]
MSKQSKGRSWKFPSAYTILFVLLILVAGLTHIMPAGYYDYQDESGQIITAQVMSEMSSAERKSLGDIQPIAGTFTKVERSGQLLYIPMAVVKGFYDSIEVAVFVLFLGGFLGVIARTRAIDVGITNLMENMKSRMYLLITILMFIFSLGGISYGMGEETIAFYPILLPIMVAAGFDVMAAGAVILLGAGVGVLASVLNPFATGIASDLAGVSLTDGMGLRLMQWAIFTPFTIFYVIRYAKSVMKNKALSVTADLNESINKEILANHESTIEKLTTRQFIVLGLFILTFVVMVFSLLPLRDWNPEWDWLTLDWYFTEIAALFFTASIIVGLVAGLKESEIGNSFVSGAKDVLGVVFVLVLSRGLKIVMEDGMIMDSILSFAETTVTGLPKILYINMIYWLHILMSIFIPSTSGLAGVSMPIMAPLAELAGVSRSLVITAYQSASGLVNLFSPTGGILMGALMLSKIPYDRYIKFALNYLIIIFLATTVLLTMGVMFNIG